MEVAEKPDNEAQRMDALRSYNLLDTLPEQDFDDITRVAAQICDTPIALVSLIDEDRQWFKSRHGLDATETHRDLAFCAHAILDPEEVLLVKDACEDERFHDNPLVTDAPEVRFYAGAPLINPEGLPLGTLCVIDHDRKTLNESQLESLQALSRQVVAQMELRKTVVELEKNRKELVTTNDELSRFAYMASHDLKTPLRGLKAVIQWMESDCLESLDEKGREYVELLKERSSHMEILVTGILDYSRASSNSWAEREAVQSGQLIDDIARLVHLPPGFVIERQGDGFPEDLQVNRTAFIQIVQNLLSNGIKYNPADSGRVDVLYELSDGDHVFHFRDDGPGIDTKYHERIYQMFQTLGEDRYGQSGTGIGLATSKRLVEKLGGRLNLDSTLGEGSTFSVSLPMR